MVIIHIMKIKIQYDGEFPNLCSGNLIVTIDEKKWVFPRYCMISGGRVWFDNNWGEHVEQGPWNISKWPDNFPEEYKEIVINEVNKQIQEGCCGGCV